MERIHRVKEELGRLQKEAEHDVARLDAYSTDHWFCVVFPTRATCDEALARLGYEPVRYVLGPEFMAAIGEALAAQGLAWPATRPQVTPQQAEELGDDGG